MQCSFCYSHRPDRSDSTNKSIIRTITPPALPSLWLQRLRTTSADGLASKRAKSFAAANPLRANEQSPCLPPDLCSQSLRAKCVQSEQSPATPFARLLATRGRWERGWQVGGWGFIDASDFDRLPLQRLVDRLSGQTHRASDGSDRGGWHRLTRKRLPVWHRGWHRLTR